MTQEQIIQTSFLPVKIVNHGNVFGTKNWFTFYCPYCGVQLTNRSEKCEGTFPLRGCGKIIQWNNIIN